MTQILTLLTESAIVQVSDRRVTHPGGRFTDIDNKAVVYLSLAAYGYTGDAEVGGRTDRLMTEVLAPTARLGRRPIVLKVRRAGRTFFAASESAGARGERGRAR